MISILIATYNWDILDLVKILSREIQEKNIKAEIICMDDASGFEQHEELFRISGLSYKCLDQNIGRAALRNQLAAQAKYPNLLFLDADSLPVKKKFLEAYLEASENYDVVCGGTAYYDDPPNDISKILRWRYGKAREERIVGDRQQAPYDSFTSNNFLIKKEVYKRIGFDESIKGYGHEDTLFGITLKHKDIPLGHIENSVYHLGLDKAEDFLNKTREAVTNLVLLYRRDMVDQEVKLIRTYKSLASWKVLWIFRIYFSITKKSILSNLKSRKPALYKFDLFKLGCFDKDMQS
jgi:GT2 family glycosyltransferase